jgi:phosphatidylglycerophosphate synthase
VARQLYDGTLARTAQWLLNRGVHPNHATFLQVPIFGVQVWAAVAGHTGIFISLILAVMFLDGMDGVLARVGGKATRMGAVLDSTFDTIGIAVVMWGTAQFFPFAETWLFALFLGNALLYLQNAVIEQKMISYVRGPLILAVGWPPFVLAGLLLCTLIVGWMLIARLPGTFRALGKMSSM